MSCLGKAGLTGFFLVCLSIAVPGSCIAAPAMPGNQLPATGTVTAQILRAALEANPSATAVLQDYCHRLAPGEPVRAVNLPADNAVFPYQLRKHLQVADSVPIRLRHVSLRCGRHILSDAWNWYVPSRLMQGMEQALSQSDIPFGRAVAALHFVRFPISSETGRLPPGALLRNTALLLRGADRVPFSYVQETYLTQGFNALHAP